MTASHWRKPTPRNLISVNAKEQSTVHALPEDGGFYPRTEELEVTISADEPAHADLRWDHISAEVAFLLYLAAETNVAKTSILCLVSSTQHAHFRQPSVRSLVSPAQYPDLAQASVSFYEEI